jgi:hypothetical protein
LSGLEKRHLELLLEVRARAHNYAVLYDERLEDFILECRDGGASARGLAADLGVSASTIQAWTANARRRRDG